MSTAECHRTVGARWSLLSLSLSDIMFPMAQVPRPPRPGQTQVPQVGDDIPGGEGALREARVSLPGDPMRH